MAGQQQQGEQLRPAVGGDGGHVLKIDDHLPNLEIDQLVDVMTFLAVEKRIASSLRERVQSTADTINAEDVQAIATRRQSGHWASTAVGRFHRCAPAGPPCRLRCSRGCGRFLRSRGTFTRAASTIPTPQRCTRPTSRSCTDSTNSIATSASRRTWPKRRAGTSSSRCGPTSRPTTSTGT